MAQKFANNATTTLTQLISSSSTLINIPISDSTKFPVLTGVGDYFLATLVNALVNPPVVEIVKVTANNTATGQQTVVRGQENSVASGFPGGATFEMRVTAGTLSTLYAAAPQVIQLYLGQFASAPSSGTGGTALIPGNLYFDTTAHSLFEYTGVFWTVLPAQTKSTQAGIYIGSFGSPPIVMPDGTALAIGTLYFDTTLQNLFIWNGSAWVPATVANLNTVAPVTGPANQTGANGVFTNLTVTDVANMQGTLLLDGQEVVPMGDVSGSIGYQNFPSGAVLQWGQVLIDPAHNTATVIFPFAYTGSPFNVQGTLFGNGLNSTLRLQTFTATGAVFFIEDTDNTVVGVPGNVMWMAIGFMKTPPGTV